MSSFNAPEFDDELLIAYLDGELSAEERARVEAHLAADPQARRLLDELRGVSLAMRELPPAKLGVDLSGSIVREAERAAQEEARTAAGGAREWTWSLPIGRSKRSWFWAATALAAGLLLMVYDRGANERHDMSSRVAMSDKARELREPSSPMVGLEVRSLEARDSTLADLSDVPETSDVPATESLDRVEPRDESTPLAATAPRASAPRARSAPVFTEADPVAAPTAGEVALGRRAEEGVEGDLARSRDFVAGGGAGGMGGAATAEMPAGAEDLVVVYVNTTPQAIEQRVFDAVLVRNDIEPEQASRRAVGQSIVANNEVDAVLVEATPFQIYGCMTELDNDKKNYLGIEVDPQTASNQRAANYQPEKLSAYNRGLVPAEQKAATQRYFYSQANAVAGQQDKPGNKLNMALKAEAPAQAQVPAQPHVPAENHIPAQNQAPQLQQFGAMSDPRGQLPQTEPSIVASQPAGERQSPGKMQSTVENAPAAPPAAGVVINDSLAAGEFDAYYAANARRAVQKLAKKADTLQVLFVLTCPTDLSPATSGTTIPEAATSGAAMSGSATLTEPATSAAPGGTPSPESSPAREGIED